MRQREHIRTFEQDGFRLELWDTNDTTREGKTRLAYELWDGDLLVFSGQDYGCSPLNSIDGDKTVGDLLGFLSLKPGDTDREYFDEYTPQQMEWCQSGRAEELGLIADDLENAR